jgi:tryptophan-rich hypothetical protein
MNPISPKKLLKTKWTATTVVEKQKHFIVTKILPVTDENEAVEHIEIEAIYSHKARVIHWHELKDQSLWLQGWK